MQKTQDAYEVGYRKPPKSGQFKKGQSGNKKGRPKGARGLKSDLLEEMNRTVSVSENGKSKKMRAQHVIVKRLINDAVHGKANARNKLLDLLVNNIGIDGEPVNETSKVSSSDEAILNDFLKRNSAELDRASD